MEKIEVCFLSLIYFLNLVSARLLARVRPFWYGDEPGSLLCLVPQFNAGTLRKSMDPEDRIIGAC